MREMIAVRAPALPAQVSGCSPRTAGRYRVTRLARGGPSPRPCCGSPCARDVLRLGSPECSPRTAGRYRVARLARGGPSPRPCCGSPCTSDVLRLALHPGGRFGRGAEPPSEFLRRLPMPYETLILTREESFA